MNETKDNRAHLLGIGLDNDDGHRRVTRAEDFSVVGGSEETHDRMTETLVKTFEELSRRGRSLGETGKKELSELLDRHRPD